MFLFFKKKGEIKTIEFIDEWGASQLAQIFNDKHYLTDQELADELQVSKALVERYRRDQ